MAKKIEITGRAARKINITDKAARRLDPKEVAAALGAEPEPYITVDRPLDIIDLAEIGTQIIRKNRNDSSS
jgi:hypothetical protein